MTEKSKSKSRRNPVTYKQVSTLCEKLISEGVRPTIPALHKRLGGSYTTLSRHKQAWEAAKYQRSSRPLPPGVLEALAAAHQSMRDDLAAKFRDARARFNARVRRAQAEKAESQKRLDDYVKETQALAGDLEASRATVSDLQQQLALVTEQLRAANTENSLLSDALSETKTALKESQHQVHTDIQDLRDKLSAETTRANQAIEERDKEIHRLRDLLDERASGYAEKSREWASREAAYKSDLDSTKKQLSGLESRLHDTSERLSSAESELATSRATIVALRDNVQTLEGEIAQLRSERDSMLQAAERASLLQEQVNDLRQTIILYQKSGRNDG